MARHALVTKYRRNFALAAIISALIGILGTLGALSWAGWLNLPQADRQTTVHDMSS